MRRIREASLFFSQFRNQFTTTGSILPSSGFLARAITRPCEQAERPARFLEAGPGTGAFTDRLVRTLGPDDELVLAEVNDKFVAALRRRIDEIPHWKERRSQIRIHHGPVESLAASERFRGIVSGLPFNNFSPESVEKLLSHFLSLLEPGGSFSFFEYLAVRRLKAPLAKPAERHRLERIGKTVGDFLQRHQVAEKRVFLNVPPAVVHHARAPGKRKGE